LLHLLGSLLLLVGVLPGPSSGGLSGPPPQTEAAVSAQTILERSLSYYESLRRSEYHCDTHYEMPSYVPKPGDWTISRITSTVRKDGFKYEAFGKLFRSDNRFPPGEDIRIVATPELVLRYQLRPGEQHNRGAMSQGGIDAYYDWLGDPFYGGFLDGYIHGCGNHHLCRLLLDSGNAVRDPDDSRSAVPCYVVHAATTHGDVIVWIAKDSNTLIAFNVKKVASHLHWGKGGGSQPLSSQVLPPGKLQPESLALSATASRLTRVHGRTFASEGTLRSDLRFSNGTDREEVYHCVRTDFLPNPDFAAGSFTLDLDNGALITDLANPAGGVRTEWKNGNVALVDADFVSKSAPFQRSGTAHRVAWLVAANFGLIAVLLAVYIWRRRRQG
jgi:hypothetical protein